MIEITNVSLSEFVVYKTMYKSLFAVASFGGLACTVERTDGQLSGFNKPGAGRHRTRSGPCSIPRAFTTRHGFLIDSAASRSLSAF